LQTDIDPIEQADDLIAKGEAARAASLLRARLDEGRGGLLARLALVRALLASADAPGALEVAREAATLNPGVPDALLALGEALMAAGHLPTAIAEYQRALRLDPQSDGARLALGRAWLEAGEAEKALEQFRVVNTDAAQPLIARAEAMGRQKRSDAGYVRHLFDQFSADYDARMRAQLSYRAPEILREMAAFVMPGAKDLTVLDLGCGTGLAAEAFGDIASSFDGIDLSPQMIEKARLRGLYHHLAVADIETALSAGGADYDLILAADTLVYLGDLTPTFAGAFRRLKAGGFFLFTVESNADGCFALGPKRRWRHAQGYLRERAMAVGFEISGLLACSPRSEAGAPVEGFAVALHKP
jgi:predicted TPR repeat methyltransferase